MSYRISVRPDLVSALDTATLIEHGLHIRHTIADCEDSLALIEQELRRRALEASAAGEVIPLNDPKLEGTQWLARGEQQTVPIVITADKILTQFPDGSPTHATISDIAGDSLPQLFRKTIVWKATWRSGKTLRTDSAALLGETKSAALVTALRKLDKNGIPENDIKICWDRAKPTHEN